VTHRPLAVVVGVVGTPEPQAEAEDTRTFPNRATGHAHADTTISPNAMYALSAGHGPPPRPSPTVRTRILLRNRHRLVRHHHRLEPEVGLEVGVECNRKGKHSKVRRTPHPTQPTAKVCFRRVMSLRLGRGLGVVVGTGN
ncbi:hypothetical protein HK104_009869, partial [Borealophlyctis nickersoniae]